MPASRRVSQRQLEMLLDFAEANKDIALGRCTRGPQASQTTQRAWENISIKLNSVAEGISKTGDQWRRYWVELKAKTKAKGADIRRNASRTGGGPNKLAPLTELEERILQLIGRVCVEGLPGVRIPFPIPSQTTSVPPSQPSTSQATGSSTQESSTSQMEVEWLEDENFPLEILSSQLSLPQPSSDLQTSQSGSPVPPLSPPQQSSQTQPASINQPQSSTPQHCPQSLPRPLPLAQSAQSSPRRRTRQHLIRDRAVPQWVRTLEERRLHIEERRLDIEERHARALEGIGRRLGNIEDIMRK